MDANNTKLASVGDLAQVCGGQSVRTIDGMTVIGDGARARVVVPCRDLRGEPPAGSAASRLTEAGRERLKGICDLYPGALSVWPSAREVL
jgi:hypothetical protein